MNCPIVETQNGKVSGKVLRATCEDAKPVHLYRNIPFAKPPVGNLRFMPPQPAEPWEGIKDGTVIGNMPIQSLEFGAMLSKLLPMPIPEEEPAMSEDCLHVSVYTPEPTRGRNLPVMVWFYGGGFIMGSESGCDGTALAGMNNVIIVVPNYRLGLFGFLTLGKSSPCTGNAGILDQQLALRWVQENIEAFGGDKTNVTIFGESVGGMSVHLHMLSPSASGLFHKAISHSGQANLPDSFTSDERNAEILGWMLKELDIKKKDDATILDILQKASRESFEKLHEKMLMEQMGFGLTLDGKTFVKMPEQAMKDKDFPMIPYMLGYNNTEGQGVMVAFTHPDFSEGVSEEDMKNKSSLSKMPDEAYDAVKKFYLKDEHGDTKFSRMLGEVTGDSMFVVPAEISARLHSEAGADVYKYIGEFQLRMSHDDAYGKEVTKKADWCMCDHGDDVLMTFGAGYLPDKMPHGAKLSDDEIALSRKWMTYITNFAKTGNPNIGEKVDVVWPKYNQEGSFLSLNHEIKSGKDSKKDIVEFWSKTIPRLEKKA